MCLSVPGQVLDVQGARALVRTAGRTVWCNALAQPEVRPDDYVLMHAGLIIAIIPPEEAQRVQEAVAAVRGWPADSRSGQPGERGAPR
jgi:hydrogenase expression/formation protein HypC